MFYCDKNGAQLIFKSILYIHFYSRRVNVDLIQWKNIILIGLLNSKTIIQIASLTDNTLGWN